MGITLTPDIDEARYLNCHTLSRRRVTSHLASGAPEAEGWPQARLRFFWRAVGPSNIFSNTDTVIISVSLPIHGSIHDHSNSYYKESAI